VLSFLIRCCKAPRDGARRPSLFARRLQEVHALTHRGVRLRPSKPAAEATPHAAEADELVHSRTPQHFVAFILSP